MSFIFQKLVDHPRLSAAGAGMIALIACLWLPSVSVSTSPRLSLDPRDPENQYFENFRVNFPDEVVLTVILDTAGVFETDILESIKRLTGQLSQLEGISTVESFATARPFTRDEYRVNYRPFLSSIPSSAGELDALREQALSSPFVRGHLIDEAGAAAAIHLIVDSRSPNPPVESRLVESVESLLQEERARLGDKAELFQVGAASIRVEESRYILKDAVTLTPIAIVVVLLILLFFFRSWSAVLLPVVTGSLSIAATLGFMGLMGYALTPLSCTIPTLLMVIGCTEDIHLISEYAAGIRRGLNRRDAIRRMARVCGIPVLLTSLTTLIGFLTLAINGIAFLREFALATSFGILVNFLFTIALTPLVLGAFPVPKAFRSPEPVHRVRMAIQNLVLNHGVAVIAVSLIATLAVAAGAGRIAVNTDPMAFFDRDSGIRQRFDQAAKSFPGFGTLFVSIETNRERGVQESDTFRRIAAFSDHLSSNYGTVQSYPEIIRFLQGEFSDTPAEANPSQADIERYTSVFPTRFRRRFLDHNGSRTVLYVPADSGDSARINAMVKAIQTDAVEKLGPGFEVRVTGQRALISREATHLAGKLIRDLAVLSGAVFLLMALLFRSIRLGLLAMIPNTIPLAVTFGMMGWLGIPLSFGTYPTALIVLCVAVNDTIHFFARYAQGRRRSPDRPEAIVQTLGGEFRPVLCSSIAISAGFLVFVLAEFVTIQQGGFLTAIALGSALVADLLITPVILQGVGTDKSRRDSGRRGT